MAFQEKEFKRTMTKKGLIECLSSEVCFSIGSKFTKDGIWFAVNELRTKGKKDCKNDFTDGDLMEG